MTKRKDETTKAEPPLAPSAPAPAPAATTEKSLETEVRQNLAAAVTAAVGRVGRFAKEHPAATLLAGAGASALIGVEFAAGALIGVGAALLTGKSAAELRAEVEKWGRQARELGGRLGEKLHPKGGSPTS